MQFPAMCSVVLLVLDIWDRLAFVVQTDKIIINGFSIDEKNESSHPLHEILIESSDLTDSE